MLSVARLITRDSELAEGNYSWSLQKKSIAPDLDFEEVLLTVCRQENYTQVVQKSAK